MSIFGSILSKIFHPGAAAEAAPSNPTAAPSGSAAQPTTPPPPQVPPQEAAQSAPAGAPATPVDVEQVLAAMAAKKGGGGNYKTSIVDLLKLLDLDSSLAARKELGNELNVHVGADGTAEENIALHKAVMAKLEENGGKVPASMKG